MIESGNREEIWGKHWGFCAWCVDREINGDPKWEFEIDSRGLEVAYACCEDCYNERVIKLSSYTCFLCGNVEEYENGVVIEGDGMACRECAEG